MQEVGHWLAASAKKVKLSIPFLIPSPTLGSFGAVTQASDSSLGSAEFLFVSPPCMKYIVLVDFI